MVILIPLPAPDLGVLAGTGGVRNQLAEDLKQLKEDHAQQAGVGTTASRPYPMFGLELANALGNSRLQLLV